MSSAEVAQDLPDCPAAKIVVNGDPSVGKTALLIRIATRAFPSEYIPTVFDEYKEYFETKEGKVLLGLWDTAGREEYDRMRPQSYPGTNLLLICFSVVGRPSFDRIQTYWLPEVDRYCKNSARILIEALKERRLSAVTQQEAEEMATKIGAVSYVETSSLSGDGIEQLQDLMASVARRHSLGETIEINEADGDNLQIVRCVLKPRLHNQQPRDYQGSSL